MDGRTNDSVIIAAWLEGQMIHSFCKKSADNLTEIPLYVISHFSLADFQDFLSLPFSSFSM
jgi:hypothetical protein